MYSVYKHTSPNGKIYVGMTKQKPQYRWGKGGKNYADNVYFWRAIQKYGWDNFKHEIVASGIEKDEARLLEIQLILENKSAHRDYGFNQSYGGGGFNGIRLTPDQRKHLSDIKKGKNPHEWTEEMRIKQSNSQKGHLGYTKDKKLSDEHKQKISESLKGHKGCETNVIKYGKPVLQFTKDGVLVARYKSQKEASRELKANISSVYKCCNHKKQKTVKGFVLRFESEVKDGQLVENN